MFFLCHRWMSCINSSTRADQTGRSERYWATFETTINASLERHDGWVPLLLPIIYNNFPRDRFMLSFFFLTSKLFCVTWSPDTPHMKLETLKPQIQWDALMDKSWILFSMLPLSSSDKWLSLWCSFLPAAFVACFGEHGQFGVALPAKSGSVWSRGSCVLCVSVRSYAWTLQRGIGAFRWPSGSLPPPHRHH